MPRRPFRLLPARVVLAALALAALSLVFSSAASAHLYHGMGGNADTSKGGGLNANSAMLLAQSFSVTVPFTLTRVGLYVSDAGGDDALSVELRSDSGGEPTGSLLASSANNTPAGYRWADFDLSSQVSLSAGVTYWIVASSSEVLGGYLWWNSLYDANSSGAAATRLLVDLNWQIRADDFAFLLYGWTQTAASLDHKTPSSTALAGAEASFLLEVHVSGLDAAEQLTIDYGYPESNLTFARDTSGSSGLSWSLSQLPGTLRYVAAQAPPGTYPFTITFLVDASVPAGTIDTTTASMTFNDFLGVPWSFNAANVSIRIIDLKMTLTSAVAPASTDPGGAVEYSLDYASDPLNSTTVPDFQVSLSLPPEVRFESATPAATYNASANAVLWSLGDLPPGAAGRVSANATAAVGLAPRFALVANLTASYAEFPTTRATLLSAFPQTTVTAPAIDVVLASNRTALRSGDVASISILLNNSGNGVAADVWINNTFDPRVRLVGVRTVGTVQLGPGVVRWNISDVAPGVTNLGLDIQALSFIDNGTIVRDRVAVAYTDGRGHGRMPPAERTLDLPVRAPRVQVLIAVDRNWAPSGGEVNETITVRNVGAERAYSVWTNQTFSGFTRYLRDSNPVAPTSFTTPTGTTYAWLMPALDPGAEVSFTVALATFNDGAREQPVDLIVQGSYTDAFRGGVAPIQSGSELLRIIASPRPEPFVSWTNPAFWALLASSSAVGVVATVERAFGRFRVQELFLVRQGGVLVVHHTRDPSLKVEPDLFAAMFTVIQDFVRDSFEYKPGRQLRDLHFGNLSGFIAPGKFAYLAVLYQGRLGPGARRALRHVLEDLEKVKGPFIEKWDGNPKTVEDIGAVLDGILRARAGFLVGLFPPKFSRTETTPASYSRI